MRIVQPPILRFKFPLWGGREMLFMWSNESTVWSLHVVFKKNTIQGSR